MNKAIEDLQEAAKLIGAGGQSLLGEIMKPGVMEHLPDNLKKVVRESTSSFDMSGIDLTAKNPLQGLNDKQAELEQTINKLKHVTNPNK